MPAAHGRIASRRSVSRTLLVIVASVILSGGSLTAIASTASATPSGGPVLGVLIADYTISASGSTATVKETDTTLVSAAHIDPGDALDFTLTADIYQDDDPGYGDCGGVYYQHTEDSQSWPSFYVNPVSPGQVDVSPAHSGPVLPVADGTLTHVLDYNCEDNGPIGYPPSMHIWTEDVSTTHGTLDTTSLAPGCYELDSYVAEAGFADKGRHGNVARFSVGGVDCERPGTVRLHLHVNGGASAGPVSFQGVITGPLSDDEVGTATVDPGTYPVVLADPTAWSVTGGSCDDPGSTVVTAAPGGPVYYVTDGHTVTCDVEVSPIGADLRVTKTLTSSTPLVVDGRANYSIEVKNLGPKTAVNVVLTDTPDARLEPQSAVPDKGSCLPPSTTVTCMLGNLPVGASAVVSVVMDVVPGSTDAATNQASATSTTPDPDPTNNISSISAGLDPDCSAGAPKRSITPAWDARIKIPHSPDPHLFNFAPTIIYCYDGQVADIRSASVVGTANPGFAEGVLSSLGFETDYAATEEKVVTNGGWAEFRGDFEFSFQPTVLINKLGIKSAAEKLAGKVLTKQLARIIKNRGYGDEFRNAIADFAATTFKKTHDEVEKALKDLTGALPKQLAKELTDFVLEKVDAILESWQAKVTASLSAGNFANWTADQVAADLVARLMAELEGATLLHFSVWSPIVDFTVGPDGAYQLDIGGIVNPFLTVSRVQ